MRALVRRASPGTRVVAAVLLGIGLAGAVVIVAVQTGSETGLLDARIYRGAAMQLRSGASIYDYQGPVWFLSSTYPPFASVVLLPLTLGSVTAAEYGITLVNVVVWWLLLALLTAVARPPAPDAADGDHGDGDHGDGDHGDGDHGDGGGAGSHDLAWAGALALVTTVSVGVFNTLNQGQVNVLLWAAIALDVVLVARGHRAAGVLTGLAAGVKLVPLAVLVLLALCGRVRVAVRGGVAFAASVALGAALAPSDSARFWTDLLFDTSRVGPLSDPQNNSLRSVLARTGAPDAVASAVWVLLAVGVLALAVRALRPALAERAVVSAVTVLGCATALVSPISWPHHLVFLAFPLVLALPPPQAGRRVVLGRSALVIGAALLLADPLGGNGRSAVGATARIAAMVALLAAGPWLARVEVAGRSGRPAGDAPSRPPVPAR